MITTFYPHYHFGGDAIHVYRLSNELARRGHHVDVIHCIDAYKIFNRKGPKGRYENHPNITVYSLKSRFGFLSPLLTQLTGTPFFKEHAIRKIFERNAYDVIHYHNLSLIGITAIRFGRAIKLLTTNEHWLICPMHVLWKYNRKVCDKKNCVVCTLAFKRPVQLWRYTGVIERMLSHIDEFISPSRFTLRKHVEQLPGIPMIRIPHFLPLGSDKSAATPNDPPVHHRPYFLFVGRLEKIKGLQNLIPVFKKNKKYELLIAGEGTYANTLKYLAGDAPNIKFLGIIHVDRLHNLYRNAIALIVPSICYEVFGIIIIESFSMKTPVIVNNLGPMPEIIEDSGGGFVYSDERSLMDAMDALAGNSRLRQQMGEKGYSAFLKYWSDENHIHQYMNLIDRIKERRMVLCSDLTHDTR